MKKLIFTLALSSLPHLALLAQQDAQVTPARPDTNLFVSARTVNSRTYSHITTHTNQAGKIFTRTNDGVVELSAGLCYQDARGAWQDSSDAIDLVANGAVATRSNHKVHWLSNLNTPGGAVDLSDSAGIHFRSRIYGLAYFDNANGSSALIADVKDSQGVLVGNHTVIYQDAFSGLKADVEYVNSLSGLSQNILIREQVPPASAYGLNPQTSVLQVLTEFLNFPAPAKTTIQENGITHDAILNFGATTIGVGQAFLTQANGANTSAGNVYKHFQQLGNDGRTFLIEEIPVPAVWELLQVLPEHTSAVKPAQSVIAHLAANRPTPRGAALPRSTPIQIAQSFQREPGLLIDYDQVASATSYTFQGDKTYLITGLCNFSNLVIEGGSVIKFTNNATAEIQVTNVTCLTATYRPAVFTTMNNDYVGDTISGSTHNPWSDYAGKIALYFPTTNAQSLQYLHFSHLAAPISFQTSPTQTGGTLNLSNFQILDCQSAFISDGATFNLYNGLINNVSNVFDQINHTNSARGQTLAGVNLTLHACGNFAADQTSCLNFTNCLLVQVTNLVTSCVHTNSNAVLASDSGVFQTVGGGSHYLPADSPYLGVGTTNISGAQWADLQTKTTYPPVVYTEVILSNSLTLSPEVQRDTGILALGYHYSPIDFAFGLVYLQRASITALPGSALGIFMPPYSGASYGIWPSDSQSTITCQGAPTALNYVVRYNTVQEQSTTNWANGSHESESSLFYTGTGAADNFRFTEWSVMAGDAHILWESGTFMPPVVLQDCQFYGGSFFSWSQSLRATNNLFQRVHLFVDDLDFENTETNTFDNNLFWQGTVELEHDASFAGGTWTFVNNLFDTTNITEDGFDPVTVTANNGFVITNTLLPTNINDKVMASSPAYQTGVLGSFYYPTNLVLTNAGSTSAANVGLYHYTITTNNIVEGTNQVSIGFHYVAIDTNNLPLDANGNGIPDYLEDFNGNGVVDSGEIDWVSTTDIGLNIWITYPANNSIIP